MSHMAEHGELNDSNERYEHEKQIRRTVTRKKNTSMQFKLVMREFL